MHGFVYYRLQSRPVEYNCKRTMQEYFQYRVKRFQVVADRNQFAENSQYLRIYLLNELEVEMYVLTWFMCIWQEGDLGSQTFL